MVNWIRNEPQIVIEVDGAFHHLGDRQNRGRHPYLGMLLTEGNDEGGEIICSKTLAGVDADVSAFVLLKVPDNFLCLIFQVENLFGNGV